MSKVWKLFLDDLREVDSVYLTSDIDKFKVARSFEEATALIIEHGCPEFISFDHDLGDDARTGKDLANWLVQRDMMTDGNYLPKNFTFKVHSANPVGSENIQLFLENYLRIKDNDDS